MSAYVVSHDTMDLILKGFPPEHLVTFSAIPGNSRTEKGRALYAMNLAAIKQRYGDLDDAETRIRTEYWYRGDRRPFDRKQWNRALSEFLYQCAEGDVPGTWPEYKALEMLL